MPDDTVAAAVEAAVAPLLADPRVGRVRKQSWQVGSKVFAMAAGGRMVVKLPRRRADTLVAAGSATYFTLGARTMKEWLALAPGTEAAWPALAAEAKLFASGDADRQEQAIAEQHRAPTDDVENCEMADWRKIRRAAASRRLQQH